MHISFSGGFRGSHRRNRDIETGGNVLPVFSMQKERSAENEKEVLELDQKRCGG